MPLELTCPDHDLLHRLLLGQVPGEEGEQLAQHLEQCEFCSSLVATLEQEDSLVDAAQQQSTVIDEAEAEEVRRLLERLGKEVPAFQSKAELNAAGQENHYDFLAPPQTPEEIGRLGTYRIFRVLGSGGMGIVFHAEDIQLERQVALKVMKPNVTGMPTAKERFLREARTAALLQHDNIVPIFQVGEDRAIPFIAMPLLNGESLEARLRRQPRLSIADVLRIGRETAEALACAHAAGLIHRDIKPANLWLEARFVATGQGGEKAGVVVNSSGAQRIKILDFGLVHQRLRSEGLTETGQVLGTPGYMAPEQVEGVLVDGRADLFSLGVVLYRMLTGRLPYPGKTMLQFMSALSIETPPAPAIENPAVPSGLSELVTRLLAKEPEQRPASAQEVADKLQQIQLEIPEMNETDRTPIAHQHNGGSRVRRQKPRRSLLVALAPAVLVAAVTLSGVVVIIRDRTGKEIARLPVPENGSIIEIISDGENKKPREMPPVTSESPPPQHQTKPLSSWALVPDPFLLKDVDSWSIETRVHRGNAESIAYQPHGSLVAVGSKDGLVRLLDASTWSLVRVLVGNFNGCPELAWSPDGKRLASSAPDKMIHIWSERTGANLKSFHLPGHARGKTSLTWSPDSRLLAACGEDGSGAVWDVAAGHVADWPDFGGHGLHWSPDGKSLLGTSEGRTWVLTSGKARPTYMRTGKEIIFSAVWSPDGRSVLTSSPRVGLLRVWESKSWAKVRSIEGECGEHARFSPDGRLLALVNNHNVIFRDARTLEPYGKPVPLSTPQITSISWSDDGRHLAIARHHRSVLVVDVESGDVVDPCRGLSPQLRDETPILARTENVFQLLCGVDRRSVVSLRTDKGRESFASPFDSSCVTVTSDGQKYATAHGNVASVLSTEGAKLHDFLHPMRFGGDHCLSWSRNGRFLATVCDDGKVRIWDCDLIVGGSKLIKTFGDYKDKITRLTWSPDGNTLAVMCGSTDLWDVESGEHRKQLAAPSVAWSPDGKQLAVCDGATVLVLDGMSLTNGQRMQAVLHDSPDFYEIAWSPDGTRIAANRQVWNAKTGKLLWKRDDVIPTYVTWTYDGGTLSYQTEARNGLVVDADTGQSVITLVSLTEEEFLAISPDGNYRGSPGIEDAIVYVVQTAQGQETLTPSEFALRYHWQNDPKKVRLSAR